MNHLVLILSAISGDSSELKVPATRLNKGQKIKGAFLSWLGFIVLACLSIFIPVAHFVLVPVFFILSFYFAFQTYKNSLDICDFAYQCPSCGKENKIQAKKRPDSFKLVCMHCRQQVFIKIKQ